MIFNLLGNVKKGERTSKLSIFHVEGGDFCFSMKVILSESKIEKIEKGLL